MIVKKGDQLVAFFLRIVTMVCTTLEQLCSTLELDRAAALCIRKCERGVIRIRGGAIAMPSSRVVRISIQGSLLGEKQWLIRLVQKFDPR